MFDPSPPGPHPDDDILPKAAHTLGNLLAAAAGICHGICKARSDHAVHLPPSHIGAACRASVRICMLLVPEVSLH